MCVSVWVCPPSVTVCPCAAVVTACVWPLSVMPWLCSDEPTPWAWPGSETPWPCAHELPVAPAPTCRVSKNWTPPSDHAAVSESLRLVLSVLVTRQRIPIQRRTLNTDPGPAAPVQMFSAQFHMAIPVPAFPAVPPGAAVVRLTPVLALPAATLGVAVAVPPVVAGVSPFPARG